MIYTGLWPRRGRALSQALAAIDPRVDLPHRQVMVVSLKMALPRN